MTHSDTHCPPNLGRETVWDHRFLDMAQLIASWSKDPSTKVGAVIVDDKNRVVSVGYNGFPAGMIDNPQTLSNRELKYAFSVHAAINAILFAKRDLSKCPLYVTHIACSNCATKVIQSGITRVVTFNPDEDFLTRWKDSVQLTEMAFRETGITLVKY